MIVFTVHFGGTALSIQACFLVVAAVARWA
jgi:hypothetical protein